MHDQPTSDAVSAVREYAKRIAHPMQTAMDNPPSTPLAWTAQHGGVAWPAGFKAGLADARAIVATEAPLAGGSAAASRTAATQARLDFARFSWEAWVEEGGRAVVGLLDGTSADEHRPLLVCRDIRDARIVRGMLAAFEVRTTDGRPIDSRDEADALARMLGDDDVAGGS